MQYFDQQKYVNSPVCSPSQYKCAEEKLDYLDGVSKFPVNQQEIIVPAPF